MVVMNTPSQQLRDAALKRRDDAIKAAKQEYDENLRKIAELETTLFGRSYKNKLVRTRERSFKNLIFENLPNSEFTIDEVCGILASVAPERNIIKHSVTTIINRFKREGRVKQTQFAGHKRKAKFALPHIGVPEVKTMAQWAKEVINDNGGDRPMKPVEILLEMSERGYQMDVPPVDAVKSLVREMKKHNMIFDENESSNGTTS